MDSVDFTEAQNPKIAVLHPLMARVRSRLDRSPGAQCVFMRSKKTKVDVESRAAGEVAALIETLTGLPAANRAC